MVSLLLAIIYLSFISLGLPDSLLGAAWPTMYPEMGVPVSYAGIVSFVIALGTIASSLMSDRVTRRFGAGKVNAVSVLMTACALFAFSRTRSFPLLILWAIPYGLGAGSVDAALNNYVALNYASRHMSWLHCMWGVGASLGPYVMGFALTGGLGWSTGYLIISIIQIILAACLFISLPLWKKCAKNQVAEAASSGPPLSLREVIAIKGAKEVMIAFFCYCAIEQTVGLWAASFLTLSRGVAAETAASFAAMFYIGVTVGRALSGFVTMKLSDKQMIYLGCGIIFFGIIVLLLPLGETVCLIALVLIGLGCAPIYPCIIHSTPEHFGAENSQALIGVQMASAYVGTCITPPIFGLIANHISILLFAPYILLFAILMTVMYTRLVKMKA